jgi:hypothetical protein
LIATAVALPVVLLVALLLTLGDDDSGQKDPLASPSTGVAAPLPAISVAAPPSKATTTAPCTKVLEQLPISLAGLAPRVVHSHPDSPFVVAWGDPAIVLRCGVDRPAGLTSGSTNDTQIVNGVLFFIVNPGDGSDTSDAWTFTVVDRAAYVELLVPKSYGQPPLGPIADAVAKALPDTLCLPQAAPGQTPPPAKQLCTHRP